MVLDTKQRNRDALFEILGLHCQESQDTVPFLLPSSVFFSHKSTRTYSYDIILYVNSISHKQNLLPGTYQRYIIIVVRDNAHCKKTALHNKNVVCCLSVLLLWEGLLACRLRMRMMSCVVLKGAPLSTFFFFIPFAFSAFFC